MLRAGAAGKLHGEQVGGERAHSLRSVGPWIMGAIVLLLVSAVRAEGQTVSDTTPVAVPKASTPTSPPRKGAKSRVDKKSSGKAKSKAKGKKGKAKGRSRGKASEKVAADTAAVSALGRWIEDERERLVKLEHQLKVRSAELDGIAARITALAQRIDQIEARYPGGVPEDEYQAYIQLLGEYNSLTEMQKPEIERFNQGLAEYGRAIDHLNERIAEYNVLKDRDRTPEPKRLFE